MLSPYVLLSETSNGGSSQQVGREVCCLSAADKRRDKGVRETQQNWTKLFNKQKSVKSLLFMKPDIQYFLLHMEVTMIFHILKYVEYLTGMSGFKGKKSLIWFIKRGTKRKGDLEKCNQELSGSLRKCLKMNEGASCSGKGSSSVCVAGGVGLEANK
jgi:hypothetical protein